MAKVGERLGRYQLDRALGRGAVGTAFAATDTRLGEQVCLKVLHPAYAADPEVRTRFEREVLLARKIAHPGVARVFDLGEEGETLYLIMQLVDGEPLSALLDRETMAPARAVALVRQACQAVAAAHVEGVIHRDLKPANMMVTPDGMLHVLDFGIATGAGMGQLTEPGKVVGSAAYMSPELWEGNKASVATDVWALGVVLYRCLTGRLPFPGEDWTSVSDGVRLREPSPPSSVRAGLDAQLDDVIARVLAKDPAQRPPGADALDQLLAPWTPDPFEAEVSSPRLSSEFLLVAAGDGSTGQFQGLVAGAAPESPELEAVGSDFTQVVSRELPSLLNEPTLDVTIDRRKAPPRWIFGAAFAAIGLLLVSITLLLWPESPEGTLALDRAGHDPAAGGTAETGTDDAVADATTTGALEDPRGGKTPTEKPQPSEDPGPGAAAAQGGAAAADLLVPTDAESGEGEADDATADDEAVDGEAVDGEAVEDEAVDDGDDDEAVNDDDVGEEAPDQGTAEKGDDGEAPPDRASLAVSPAAKPKPVAPSRRGRTAARRASKSKAAARKVAASKASGKKTAYARARGSLDELTRSRGLRSGDVPAVDKARRSMRKAAKRRRWDEALKQAEAARRAAKSAAVDREFITKKLRRFNKRYDAVENVATKEELGDLSMTITKAVMAKDYVKANTLLNRGFAKAAKAR